MFSSYLLRQRRTVAQVQYDRRLAQQTDHANLVRQPNYGGKLCLNNLSYGHATEKAT
jgi:hypothetical protein